jgi:glucan endo-1,3-alpha-glucosidase
MQFHVIKPIKTKGLALCGLVLMSVWSFASSPDSHFRVATVGGSAMSRQVLAHWWGPMGYKSGQRDEERWADDIRAAREEGVDGFVVNAFSGAQARLLLNSVIHAADKIGAYDFRVALSADMSLRFKPEEIVTSVAEFAENDHYLKINGKPLLSTYGGDRLGNQWWSKEVLQPLKAIGTPVTFIPDFDRPDQNRDNPSYENWRSVIASFPVVDGLFNFGIAGSAPFYTGDTRLGHHWWSSLEAEENLSKALHERAKLFIAPYTPSTWSVCHSARQYSEYQGGRGMASWWTSIIEKQRPELVELVTWNDYTESTYIQPTQEPLTSTKGVPSYSHVGYYELLKYYIAWYKSGVKPTLAGDGLFYFYQPTQTTGLSGNAKDAYCSMGAVPADQVWGLKQDVIYLTTVLTEPAELRVTTGKLVGHYSIPSGIVTTDVPFGLGSQSFALWRRGTQILSINGSPIVKDPVGQNFNITSGYAIAGGRHSEDWMPTQTRSQSPVGEWFKVAR